MTSPERLVLGIAVILMVLSGTLRSAQETISASQAALKKVETAQAAMEADSSLKSSAKDLLRPTYQEAIEAAQQAVADEKRTAAYRGALETGASQAADLLAQRERLPPADQDLDLTVWETAEALQRETESRRAALAELQRKLNETNASLKGVESRPIEISERLPLAEGELEGCREKLALAQGDGDGTSPGRVAERTLLEAQEAALLAEMEMLNQERLSMSVRGELQQTRRSLLTRQIENARAALDVFKTEVHKRLVQEAKEVAAVADQSPLGLNADDTEGLQLVEEVRQLAKDFEEVVASLQEAAGERGQNRTKLDHLRQEHTLMREQIEVGGGGETIARSLFDLQHRLPGRRVLAKRQEELKDRLDEARLGLLGVGGKMREQAAVEQQFADRSSKPLARLVANRKDILEKLSAQYRTLIGALSAVYGDGVRYQAEVTHAREFVFEQLFWVRSSPPIGASTFRELPEGVGWLVGQSHRRELIDSFWGVCRQTPMHVGLVGVLIAGLLVTRPRVTREITRRGVAVRRISTDSYSSTLWTLFYSILLALPAPLIFASIAWALGQAPDPTPWLRAVARSMEMSAGLVLSVGILGAVCRKGGLGIAHFGWRADATKRFRHALLWLAVGGVPALGVAFSSLFGAGGRYFNSLGVVCAILASLGVAYLLWRLFRFSDGVLAPLISDSSELMVVRLRHFWFPVLIGSPLALAVLAAVGYPVSAVHLGIELFATGSLLAGGAILYWLLLRWFMIKQRRLALAEALEERRARREQAATEAAEAAAGEVVSIDDEEEEPDLSSIGEQTRHLLRSCFIVGGLMTVGFLWSNTIPIYQVLGTVTLIGELTVLQAMHAALIVLIVWITVKDLPGLLDLGVLRSTKLELGTRVAISTLAQYAVMTLGLALLFQVLDMDWSKFGWIAAALSVGLGFGLQEVVANFVSGVILLFECPIRVGDVVTVDGMTGTVTRIRMRATTITNWDRQDYVVPNKTLVTGALLNWTLSNAVTRVIVSVGVAYGTDTDVARRLLLEIAADHPRVLDDPAPMASFEEFADSTLNLSLRAYLPDVENRLATITELNAEVDRRFAQAGIEIAFPQRVIHSV